MDKFIESVFYIKYEILVHMYEQHNSWALEDDRGLWIDTQLPGFVCLHTVRKQHDLEPSHVLWFPHILHVG